MERLTYVKKPSQFDRGKYPTKYTSRHTFQEVVARLAAYEDTGLEPDEITTEPYGCVFYCNRECNLNGDWCVEGPGCPNEINTETAKHLLELAQAEKDGRLVVLPCKVGDTVYRVFCVEGRKPVIAESEIKTVGQAADLAGRIGKRARFVSVFLTREEAEAALEGTTA